MKATVHGTSNNDLWYILIAFIILESLNVKKSNFVIKEIYLSFFFLKNNEIDFFAEFCAFIIIIISDAYFASGKKKGFMFDQRKAIVNCLQKNFRIDN